MSVVGMLAMKEQFPGLRNGRPFSCDVAVLEMGEDEGGAGEDAGLQMVSNRHWTALPRFGLL
jgi:hypothetical protein